MSIFGGESLFYHRVLSKIGVAKGFPEVEDNCVRSVWLPAFAKVITGNLTANDSLPYFLAKRIVCKLPLFSGHWASITAFDMAA